ncbi:MAG: 4-hydroxythreonine-4-phosphate dehydrogenase PdxA [Candidatus Margulisiibacteriota bacterium]
MAKPRIAVTMGDPAGIGPEICSKALLSPEVQKIADCILIGDKRFIKENIPMVDLKNADPKKIKIGINSKAAGQASFEYLMKAIELVKTGKADAIATAPINKKSIQMAGHKFQGHTEILAKYTNTKKYAMLFVSDIFWVALATIHIPFNHVSKSLNRKKLFELIQMVDDASIKYRKIKPRIAVSGLNPHAGESGIFGKEEITTITPAVNDAIKAGIDVKGPISPDAVFHLARSGMFDIVIAMYHDQGLIPLKLLAFGKCVNVTIGLPFVRTSVDHGTGFDIAGMNVANPKSLIQAIKVAALFSGKK